jgi:hypothetical protein
MKGRASGGFLSSFVLAAAALAVAAGFTLPLFRHPGYWGVGDWDLHLFLHEIPRLTVARYHQFPLWNPYYCGGTPMLANPESRFLSPFFFLHLLCGPAVAIKLEIVLHLFMALVGVYLLARKIDLDPLCAALSSALFALSSMFAVNLANGMSWFLAVAYLPWAFLFAVRGWDRTSNRIGAALCLAFCFGEGGGYPLVVILTLLALDCAWTALARRSIRIVAGFAATLALTLAVGAIKFLPAIEYLHEHPRPMSDDSGFSAASLIYGLTARDQSIDAGPPAIASRGPWAGMSYGIDENGMYIGWIPLVLCAVGILAGRRARGGLLFTLVFFLVVSMGDRLRPDVWWLLHRLPVYRMMRVAQRFRPPLLLAIALFSGAGLKIVRESAARRLGRPRWARAVAVLLVVGVLADLWLVDRTIWSSAFIIPPRPTAWAGAFSQTSGRGCYDARGGSSCDPALGASSAHLPAALGNQGSVDCYTSLNVKSAAVARGDSAYRGELFLEGTEGSADYAEWSPNHLAFDVRSSGKGELIVNQNYSPHWRSGDGRPVLDRDGLLAVRVSAADRRLELDYRPLSFAIGAAVSASTLAAIAALMLLPLTPF